MIDIVSLVLQLAVAAIILLFLYNLAYLIPGPWRCPFCEELSWTSQHRRCRKAYLLGLQTNRQLTRGREEE